MDGVAASNPGTDSLDRQSDRRALESRQEGEAGSDSVQCPQTSSRTLNRANHLPPAETTTLKPCLYRQSQLISTQLSLNCSECRKLTKIELFQLSWVCRYEHGLSETTCGGDCFSWQLRRIQSDVTELNWNNMA